MSTTSRTTQRTSSSASDACRTRVAVAGRGGRTSPAGSSSPIRSRDRRTVASARVRPVCPATTTTGTDVATARTRLAEDWSRSCGRNSTSVPTDVRLVGRSAGGGAEQVGRVVPPVGQARADRAVQRDHVRGERRGRTDVVERARRQVAEGAVRLDQSADGGGMGRDRCERPGVVGERVPPRRGEDRAGHRPPPATGQQGCGEQLRQAGKGGHGETGDAGVRGAVAPRERTACRQAAHVGGDDQRHRSQRVGALEAGHRVAKRVVRRCAVARRHSFDRNRQTPSRTVVRPR